jgi:hypothetical protein
MYVLGFAIRRRRVHHPCRLQLDGNTSFALEIHIVQKLGFHIARCHGLSRFQQAIRQRTLAMINVRDDTEIPNFLRIVPVIGLVFIRSGGLFFGAILQWSLRLLF